MQARSALFDLYGDHLRPRGGRAQVSALVRLLDPLGIAAPAVRTAISRMVQQGWLRPLRLAGGPGYQLTVKAVHRLDEAAARIYRTGTAPWAGEFDLVMLDPLPRLVQTQLAFLGYGRVGPDTWIAPRRSHELEAVLREAGVRYERFNATHTAGQPGAAALVRRAWDLAALAGAYDSFVADQTPLMTAVDQRQPDEAAYAARFRLVHQWRTFLFRDPQLPPELLPDPWAGNRAAAFFDEHEGRLRPAADRFVDRCLPPR